MCGVHRGDRIGVQLRVQVAVGRRRISVAVEVADGDEGDAVVGEDRSGGVTQAVEADGAEVGGCGGALVAAAQG